MEEEKSAYNGQLRAPSGLVSKAQTFAQNSIAKEKAAIDHELTLLHQALEHGHQLISQLEQSVSPVSTPLPPQDNSLPSHETVGSSRVYGAIHEAVTGVHVLQERIATVLRNLEV